MPAAQAGNDLDSCAKETRLPPRPLTAAEVKALRAYRLIARDTVEEKVLELQG